MMLFVHYAYTTQHRDFLVVMVCIALALIKL